jgi:O-antigen/teichoic acid export membrane protein
MIPIYGISGAAVATSFMYFMMLVLALYYYYNNDLKFVVRYQFYRMTALTLSFLVTYYFVYSSFGGQSLISILVVAFIGLLLFVILSYLFGLLTKKEYHYFKYLLNKKYIVNYF